MLGGMVEQDNEGVVRDRDGMLNLAKMTVI